MNMRTGGMDAVMCGIDSAGFLFDIFIRYRVKFSFLEVLNQIC